MLSGMTKSLPVLSFANGPGNGQLFDGLHCVVQHDAHDRQDNQSGKRHRRVRLRG